MLSGRETLVTIDEALGKMRRESDALDAQFQRAGAAFAKARQAQLALFAQMARIRVQELESGELVHALNETDRRVTEILEARKAAQASLAAELEAAEELLAERERERTQQQAAVDAAAQAVDDAEREAQEKLAADEAYQAKLASARETDAMADHAESKSEAAETDRVEKGRPYEDDRVFSYLWQRGFGTSQYRAWPPARLLDRRVARSSNFEALRRNYSLLTEIPKRLAEHAQRMRAAADRDLQAVRSLEQQAAEAAGVPARRQALEAAEQRLAEMDEAIDRQESAIDALVDSRGGFAAGEDEYSKQCAALLGEVFQRADVETLRELVARTRSREDDLLIEELEELEEQRGRHQQELIHYRRLHQAQRERTLALEDVRRRFKQSRYDDMHSVFVNAALIGALLDKFLGGSVSAGEVWEAIEQQQRYRGVGANPRFGTGGFPRSPFPPPWRMPGGGRWNFPKGGGFGGGGFGTGGGFGGGGFRTGGGF